MGEKYYRVVRFRQTGGRGRVLKRDLTLKQAQAWCNDPETSSKTAASPKGCNGDERRIEKWSKAGKHWFDGPDELFVFIATLFIIASAYYSVTDWMK